ncbi:MAG: hypothetical protein IPH69_06805 [Bacteroidales bacterium]|nr:hypothetical protein [Bacteroidales bacterium]
MIATGQNYTNLMVAELEKILYDDGGGFRATYIADPGGSGIFILNMNWFLI